MIEINKNPSKGELNWFGLLALAFFGLVGAATGHKSHNLKVAWSMWLVGLVLAAVYYAVPSLRRRIYVGWMYAVYPIGWVVSHVMMAVVFYGILTPVGLLMRWMGHDPLQRTLDRSAASYWIGRPIDADPDRHFRQF